MLSVDGANIDRPFLSAQSIDLTQPLTLNALSVIAVLENADLRAQRAKAGVGEAQAFAARLIPDPSLGANFDKRLSGPDPYNGFGAQLGIDLNQLRTARLTRAASDASQRQVRLDIAWAEWQTACAARLQAVRVVSIEQQLQLARASAAAAEHFFAAASRAGGRGDLSAAEVDTRRQAARDATDRLRAGTNELLVAQGELNRQLGLSPATRLTLAPITAATIAPAAEVLVDQAIERRLDMRALRAGYDVAETGVHKAILDQFPNLSVTIAGTRDTARNYTIGPAIGFSLPLWNRNRGGIATATATRAQLRAEYEARLFQTRADIHAAVAGIAAARQQRVVLVAALPATRNRAAASSRAAKRGDIAPAVAATDEQAVRDRQLTLLQLDQQIAEQTIALELLSGGPSEGWTK